VCTVKRTSLVLLAILLGVGLMVLTARRLQPSANAKNGGALGGLRGAPAPDFTLKTLDGSTLKLSDLRGKAVLLNFWATWCAPCKIETPWIVDLQNRYAAQGLQVVGVSMDDESDTEEIKKFVQEMHMTYPILRGTEDVGSAYGGLEFLPTTYFVGRDGNVTGRILGLKGRSDMEENVKKALATAPASQTARR
jgi:peroxiredoxin